MTTISGASSGQKVGLPLNIGLWAAQTTIFVLFILFGYMKLFMPVQQLAAMWVWPGQLPVWFLHMTGIIDIAGGAGVLLPALTRIWPRLTVFAALGCVLLQACAIIFHVSRGEAHVIPLNIICLILSAFILWGRGIRAPVLPRSQPA